MATEKEIELCMTPEQKYWRRKHNDIWLPRDILFSKAWQELRDAGTAAPIYLYLMFREKLQPIKLTGARGKKKEYDFVNKDNLILKYEDAKKYYGLDAHRFVNAIDLLIKFGLLDITYQGSGLQGDYSRYGISERWKLYGTPEFIVKKRTQRPMQYGFTKGNRHGKNT